MILSFASAGPAGQVLLAASALSALLYAWVAGAHQARPRALILAWSLHLLALVVDIAGLGTGLPGARFGFAPALSMTIWLVLGVYLVESRFLPLPSAQRVLSLAAVAVLLLAAAFPGESRPQAASPWAPLHWVLGLASYGLFGVAVLHAAMLSRAERQMRTQPGSGSIGLPLLRLERLTFQFVGAGVLVLSAALLMGWLFSPQWRWDHKTLFAVLGWLVLTGLLTGRQVFGWRGRRATRWLYLGAALLLLSYAGSRFVLEVVLQRGMS
ncbi:cytochrome c biogenesis protein CcsA [Pelomonas sp. CA6]|uniref:cytochrome C assembly family protein n=1 Tax=Pelomonas sp. CA6 TaxID=2907999 RepID=UPI001F4C1A3D|nr:cytochrome c biogenesis protein CcsA [Pelomonas sp. CA6]MCH7344307.1 cytochrome c biogenesis protein CcsA [Pelomonas sp. CA6]